LAVGIVLFILALIFVVQVWSVAREVAERPNLTMRSPGGGMQFDLGNLAIHEFFFTTQGFVLFHVWLIWATVKFVRSRGPFGRSLVAFGGLGLVTVLVGHACALWLASKGTHVGLW
jgi:hypothetical protein